MIELYRYSNFGYEPQYQRYFYQSAYIDLKTDYFNEYTTNLILQNHNPPCYLFEFDGVFAFIGKPTDVDKRYYLNHLPDDNLPLHIKEFDESTIVYANCGLTYEPQNRMTLKEAKDKNHIAVYIPKSSLVY